MGLLRSGKLGMLLSNEQHLQLGQASMTEPTLHSDCTQCAALCCMAFAFDKSDDFAFDKAAETACAHLDGSGQCRVHADLEEQGFRGCAVYECHGAGQRVTQELFGGRSWQDEPSLIGPMSRAFATVRRLHRLLKLLDAAVILSLSPADEARRTLWAERVNELVTDLPSDPVLEEMRKEVHSFVRSLRHYVGRRT